MFFFIPSFCEPRTAPHTMYDIIRDAPLGQAIRWISRNKYLQYPEEAPDFELLPQYRIVTEDERTSQPLGSDLSGSRTRIEQPGELDEASRHSPSIDSGRTEEAVDVELGQIATRKEDGELERLRTIKSTASVPTAPYTAERFKSEQHMQALRTQSIAIVPEKTKDGVILVNWYTTDDPANPQNWSRGKKAFITLVVCGYTRATYIAGALFAPCEPGVEQHFCVSPEASELWLSLYVLAYGVGPMIFGPLTEIPAVGRNPVYFFSFIIFFALSFPTAVVSDFGGFLALRFFQGFFSSPAIGIGGASITDVYAFLYAPYGLGWWVYSFWSDDWWICSYCKRMALASLENRLDIGSSGSDTPGPNTRDIFTHDTPPTSTKTQKAHGDGESPVTKRNRPEGFES